MLKSLKTLVRHQALLRALTVREVQARYRGSVLGFFWSFLNPLLLLLVYTLVFGFIFAPRLGSGPEPYAVFLFTGLLPWTWFAGALLEGANSVLNGGALLRKVVFPAEVLPLVSVLANAAHFVIALPVLVAVLWINGHAPGRYALLVPLLLVIQFLFTAGLTMALSALSVIFRDVRDLLVHIVNLWFFATPIIYEMDLLPASFRAVLRFNPMGQIIRGWQDALFFNRAPSLTGLGGAAIAALASAFLGYLLFDRLRDVLPEEV